MGKMGRQAILDYFKMKMDADRNMSEAVAAIRTLIEFIKTDSADTLVELRENLRNAIGMLMESDHGPVTSISSGGELFLRFITLTALDHSDFQECKNILVDRGFLFLKKLESSRKKISRLAHPFIRDGVTVLTHSSSRVVLEVLEEAFEMKKRFTVYVTESMPDGAGRRMCEELTTKGIPNVLILDAAVGYIMEKVDLVIVGAEGVVESGGIINKIGTYTMATCARNMNKPFYVVAESFKFARWYPLNQQDVPKAFKYQASKLSSNVDLSREHPMVDYTPPIYLTLLFTDLGVLTPSAVSDELIKLYL